MMPGLPSPRHSLSTRIECKFLSPLMGRMNSSTNFLVCLLSRRMKSERECPSRAACLESRSGCDLSSVSFGILQVEVEGCMRVAPIDFEQHLPSSPRNGEADPQLRTELGHLFCNFSRLDGKSAGRRQADDVRVEFAGVHATITKCTLSRNKFVKNITTKTAPPRHDAVVLVVHRAFR